MNNTSSLYVVKLSEKATVPTRGSAESAGLDLYATEEFWLPPLSRKTTPLQLKIRIPKGHYGRIAPRSGLAAKHHIGVGAGVIDSDYRGEVGVVLFNHSSTEAFKVNHGDRIAQLILEKISIAEVIEVQDLEETERGSGGFGSTGK